MSASEAWTCAWTFGAVALAVAGGTLLAALLLRVRSRKFSEARTRTYECGEEPDGGAWMRFHPRYYLVALVFVIFDVEAIFLLPWAVSLRDMGAVALWSMLIFLSILLLGWIYAVRKGALRWP
jgi:NAD(P)H-quinone oxidoreductase subunit 3